MAQVETKTLYFIEGAAPNAVDNARIAKLPGIVMVRNASEAGDSLEEADFVTAGDNVTIPTQYAAYTRVTPEKPLSLEIVPNTLTIDLSDVEHADLRAIARFSDGTATDVTTSCAWSSATPGVATIGAATGIATPIGAGTSVITATYNFAGPGEVGSLNASKVFTVAGNAVADEAVVAGLITYTFKATPAATSSATAVQVKVGATKEESLANLRAAIMGAKYGKGTLFSSDAPVNTLVRADIAEDVTPAQMTVTAKQQGTAGNAIAISETMTAGSWAGGATTLSAGANATTPVTDTMTLTVQA